MVSPRAKRAAVHQLITELGLSEWPAPCFRSGLIGSQSGVVQVQCSAYSVGVL